MSANTLSEGHLRPSSISNTKAAERSSFFANSLNERSRLSRSSRIYCPSDIIISLQCELSRRQLPPGCAAITPALCPAFGLSRFLIKIFLKPGEHTPDVVRLPEVRHRV